MGTDTSLRSSHLLDMLKLPTPVPAVKRKNRTNNCASLCSFGESIVMKILLPKSWNKGMLDRLKSFTVET